MAGASTDPDRSPAWASAFAAGADSGTTSERLLLVLSPSAGRYRPGTKLPARPGLVLESVARLPEALDI